MANVGKSNKRDMLLHTACQLVREKGVAALTLEAVASKAGVSKGGLLYHFPSKEALIEGMVHYVLEQFHTQMEQSTELDDDRPGQWMRAYIRSTFDSGSDETVMSSALLAAIATNHALLEPVRERYEQWQERLVEESTHAALATIVRLAADGLWYAETFGLAAPEGAMREQIMSTLLQLAEEALQQ